MHACAESQRDMNVHKGDPKKFQDVLKKGDIDLDANIAEAESMSFEDWEKAVKSNGNLDYKVKLIGLEVDSKLLDNFGNYHFVVVTAHGFN